VAAASEGHVIVVARGTYAGFRIDKANVTITSRFCMTKDPADLDGTVINGSVIASPPSNTASRLIGFTIRGSSGVDPISINGGLTVLHNRIRGGKDAIGAGDMGRTEVYICGNHITGAGDDGIDFDGPTAGTVEQNTVEKNGGDGLETRLHRFTGGPLEINIRNNVILDNGEDGVQLIGGFSANPAGRSYRIERNVIRTAEACLGLMDGTETNEDYRGAALAEQILVLNNTFVDCNHGISGGGNMLAANNIFVRAKGRAVWRVGGSSVVSKNLFFMNATHHAMSNVDATNLMDVDPMLAPDHTPAAGSPAIDAGVASLVWKGAAVTVAGPGSFAGAAPDIGAKEKR
jgi:hypothetical protein